jgi:RNA polymerase sigma factor (TIGR02999 family)
MEQESGEITLLLHAISNGDQMASKQLWKIAYRELKRIASNYLKKQLPANTMSTTDLVHEVFLKLMNANDKNWRNRQHFFRVISQAMRQVLVDLARKQKTQKRGNGAIRIQLNGEIAIDRHNLDRILAINDALEKLTQLNTRQGKVVELRFFAGLSLEETAKNLEVSLATIKRDWNLAKAWLTRELGENEYA